MSEANGDVPAVVQRPGLQTRKANATKHPGRAVTDLTIHRRSHSEVVAARKAAEDARVAEAAEQLKKIKLVASIRFELEKEMAQEKARRSSRLQGVTVPEKRSDEQAAGKKSKARKPPTKTAKKSTKTVEAEERNVVDEPEEEVAEIETERGGKKRTKATKASASKKGRTSLPDAIPSSPLSEIAELSDEMKSKEKGKEKGVKKSSGAGAAKKKGGKQKISEPEPNPFADELEDSQMPRLPENDAENGDSEDGVGTDNEESEITPMDVDDTSDHQDDERNESPGVKRPKSRKKNKHQAVESIQEQVALLRQREKAKIDSESVKNTSRRESLASSSGMKNAKSTGGSTSVALKGERAQGKSDVAKLDNTAHERKLPVPSTRSEPRDIQNWLRSVIPSRLNNEEVNAAGSTVGSTVTHSSITPSDSVSQVDGPRSRAPLNYSGATPARPSNKDRIRAIGHSVRTPRSDESLEPRTPLYTRGSPAYAQPRGVALDVVVDGEEQMADKQGSDDETRTGKEHEQRGRTHEKSKHVSRGADGEGPTEQRGREPRRGARPAEGNKLGPRKDQPVQVLDSDDSMMEGTARGRNDQTSKKVGDKDRARQQKTRKQGRAPKKNKPDQGDGDSTVQHSKGPSTQAKGRLDSDVDDSDSGAREQKARKRRNQASKTHQSRSNTGDAEADSNFHSSLGTSSSGSTTKVDIIIQSPEKESPVVNLNRETKFMKVEILNDDGEGEPKLLEVKQEHRARSTSLSRSKSNLPCGIADEKRWSNVFIPTFMSHIGTLADPWHPLPHDVLRVLQAIWDVVYHDKPYRIQSVSDIVCTIARQRVCEWRNKFLNHAQTLFAAFLKTKDWTTRDDREHIREYVSEMLGAGYPFIMKSPDAETGKGPFQSEFVAAVLSCHLHFVRDAAQVKNIPLTATHSPVGALTLASLACLRVLEAHSTGVAKYTGRFSGDALGSETTYFSKSILQLGAKTWVKIRAEGARFVPSGSRRSSAAEVVVRAPVEQRPLIQDDEDSD
ncbi:hypothetical protein SCHPADRAFT_947798 [Schizopora paradoxa]|uniref:DUF6532 domain-containing protein n=1 Tax=Schizopora paradoxa TaxID=27342 RepID=A0A0H2QY55_9AGAM|nr:hypothetical protein SCHPADRAFT_947798 [Schizopora paradoxa]